MYVLNLQRLSLRIQSNPARKHFTHLHCKLGIMGSSHTENSCRVPLQLISTLNCLLSTLLPRRGSSLFYRHFILFSMAMLFSCVTHAADLALSHAKQQSEMVNK